MKRDLDLIRLILLDLEAREEMVSSEAISIFDYTSQEIAYNIGLLADYRYIDVAGPHIAMSGSKLYMVKGITFRGHDYLDAVRKAGVWNRVKDAAAKQGIGLTLEIAKEYALYEIRTKLGIVSAG